MPLPISFNNIPGSGLVAPLFAFEVNSAGQFQSTSRLLLMGHATSSGAATANVPFLAGSQGDVDAACGAGSMLREMYRIARQNAPVQEIWLIPVPASGTAPTWTLTVGSAATGAAGTATLKICDETIQITIGASDTTSTIATALAAAINAYVNSLTKAMLPVTATASSAVVTLTARHAGAIMGDLENYVPASTTSQSNIFAVSGALTVASVTSASGNPTVATALNALGDDQYDMIVAPWSDSTSLSAYAAFSNDTSGRWAYSRQSYSHIFTASPGALSAQTTFAASLNDRHLTAIPFQLNSPQPGWLFAAGMVARVAPWLGDYTTGNVSRNQTDLVVQGLTCPRDRTTLWNYASRNALLAAGISTWKGNVDGTISIDKLVTLQKTGASGLPDVTFRDVQALLQATHILRYMRAQLAYNCANKAIAALNPGNLGAIVTPKDIKAVIVGAYDQLARWGLVQDVDGFAQALNVQIDSTYGNRVNCFLAIDRVKPLDILAANATFYGAGIPKAA